MYLRRQTFFVVGLSRSGISATNFLLERGARVYLYDDVNEGQILLEGQKLVEKGGILLKKEEIPAKMNEIDALVLSPGIPIDHSIPVAFKKAGKRIMGETELGVLFLRATLLAVTGTNGKTTTVSLLDAICREGGLNSVACGNIGKPITSCVNELSEDGFAVAEISSFQLETLSSHRPHIAVVLNLTEDHLNRHYNMENYGYLKAKLLKNQLESEYAVLNYDDKSVRAFAEKTRAKTVWFSLREQVEGAYYSEGVLFYQGEKICEERELALGGRHNLANCLAAICCAKLVGVSNEAIAKALSEFQGVKHRIQTVGSVNGVAFINDSKATNVDSTVKAIESVKGETVLLLGGKDKGYSYEPIFDAISRSSVVHTVLYGENAFQILACAVKKGYHALTLCKPFDLAVRVAYLTAVSGQNVLLSPASASFDSFSGYEERGERFEQIMNELKEQHETVLSEVAFEECEERDE